MDLIENSLFNLLLKLSYKINLELLMSNLTNIKISENLFKFLTSKNFTIKYPRPFVMDIDFNKNQSLKNCQKFPSIFLLNVTTVELEFQNLNLSIQRNKINELKCQFQLLIKKERYWRQKEINLNKVYKRI